MTFYEGIKDYVRLAMTGEKATEPSDAAGTLLFDVRRSCWSEEMVTALQLDPSLLPPVRGSTSVTGGLTARGSGSSRDTLNNPASTA